MWNHEYYQAFVKGAPLPGKARRQAVRALNIKSDSIIAQITENVHVDKGMGIAEISKEQAEAFCQRHHPEKYEQFLLENAREEYPIYLDFENVFTAIENTPVYKTLLEVAKKGRIDLLEEKTFLANFIVIQNLRSHSVMNAMIEWGDEIGSPKFEHLIMLKWMLSDPAFMMKLVMPLINSKWSLFFTEEADLALCDSPILISKSDILVALSPHLLLKINKNILSQRNEIYPARKLSGSGLKEYRVRTIGNTFREIIGRKETLEFWQNTPEFRKRYERLRSQTKYNQILHKNGNEELWVINALANVHGASTAD